MMAKVRRELNSSPETSEGDNWARVQSKKAVTLKRSWGDPGRGGFEGKKKKLEPEGNQENRRGEKVSKGEGGEEPHPHQKKMKM